MKCDFCGKEFEGGISHDGSPNGVEFGMEDGTIINICADCIMSIEPEDIEILLKEREDE